MDEVTKLSVPQLRMEGGWGGGRQERKKQLLQEPRKALLIQREQKKQLLSELRKNGTLVYSHL